MTRICTVLLAASLLVGCGGGEGGRNNNPVAPTPTFPQVAGNYTGTTTVVFPELNNQRATCPTTTTVTQNGGDVNIAPLQLGGECGGLAIPVGGGQISNSGALPGAQNQTFRDPSCGTYNFNVSGGFFGRELRIAMNATSATCYNMNITINLTR